VAGGATLDLNNASETTGSLSGAGNVILGTATASIGGDNGSATFSGAISGAGNVTKIGAGVQALSGANTYTGATTVNAGQLILSGSNNSTSYRAAGGTLKLNGIPITLTTGSLRADAGGLIEYNGVSVAGGFMRGPGTHTIASGTNSFTGVNALNGTVIQQNAVTTLTNFTSGAAITSNAALTWDGGTNGISGQLIVNNTAAVNSFDSSGVITVNSAGALNNSVSNLTCGGGSRTTVNSGGQVNMAGGTQVDLSGALMVNNGTVNGDINVYYGSRLQGVGTFNGAVNVYTGGTFAPGNSPGTATSSSANLGAGGLYQFEIRDANGPSGVETDLWNVLGTLNITAGNTDNSKFVIDVDTLAVSSMPGLAAHFDSSMVYHWTLIHSGALAGFSADKFAIDVSGFLNSTGGGSFSISQSGSDLMLNFQPVPEPGMVGILGIGALMLRRRRVTRSEG
jgi:autotransporter-associated beta strand protein